MINAFALEDARLVRIDESAEPLNTAIWLDLIEPTIEERETLQENLGQSLASFLELEDIEASARFFEDEDGLHLHSFFYCEDENDYADLASVAFTIRDGRLFTELRRGEASRRDFYERIVEVVATIGGGADAR